MSNDDQHILDVVSTRLVIVATFADDYSSQSTPKTSATLLDRYGMLAIDILHLSQAT
jgi:hypothetical protein